MGKNMRTASFLKKKTVIRSFLILFFGLTMLGPIPGFAAKPTLTNTDDLISIEVDVDICLTGYSFCSDLGLINPAQAFNDSPILLAIQISTPFGVPLSGLVDTDFRINTVRSINGAVMQLPACATCFVDRGNGIYTIALRQAGTWGFAGTYMGQLEVDVTAAKTLYRLVSFEIP